MHIDTYGQGGDASVILLHGWAMHGGIFKPLAERLSRHARVHVVDLPGHGFSPEGEVGLDVADSVERLSHLLPPSIWVGWSLGGLFVLRAAMTPSANVRGIAMIAASPCFVARGSWDYGVDLSVLEQFGAELTRDYRGTIERFLALEAMGDEHATVCLRELRAQAFERGEPAASVLETGLYLLEHSDYRDRLSQVTCPSIWVAGARDRLVPWQAMEWGAEVSRGRFHRVDGAAHAPFLTHLAEVAAQIELLLRNVAAE